MLAIELLQGAKTRIIAGWAKGVYKRVDAGGVECLCSMGALAAASAYVSDASAATEDEDEAKLIAMDDFAAKGFKPDTEEFKALKALSDQMIKILKRDNRGHRVIEDAQEPNAGAAEFVAVIINTNDEKLTQKQDVINAFDAAIKSLEEV